MPMGNRTGPDGLGPMTGRGAGYCAGYTVPGFINSIRGRLGMAPRSRFSGQRMPGLYTGAYGFRRRPFGFRAGRGGGRGRRW